MSMDSPWQYLLLSLYVLTSLGLMIYGGHCYMMAFLFLRRQKRERAIIQAEVEEFNRGRREEDYPLVTVQLPIYNEQEVVERLLRSTASLDYPRDRLEIQVLDDSGDKTRGITDQIVSELRGEGVPIRIVRRPDRRDFKAGALANATPEAKGDYLAIFDADFVIPPAFLKRVVALIHPYPDVACVQARWGHTNRRENWLTRAQSVGIDGHFTAEQGARSYNALCMNFNGTAGIWRKTAIQQARGWQGDTLTEDLDLSYRVQLEGYRIRFDFDLECPAELPNNVVALKSQQRRWAKGSMETAKKLLPVIWRSPRLTLGQKAEAFIHLTHYFVAVLMVVICLLTLPMLLWIPLPRIKWVVGILWTIIGLSSLAPCVMYTVSGYVLRRAAFSLLHFPAMLVTGTGLCLNNAWAVLEALVGHKSEFVRTPKSGSTNAVSRRGGYRLATGIVLPVIEVLLGLYCLHTLNVYLHSRKYLFGFFIAAYGAGFLSFGILTLKDHLLGLLPALRGSAAVPGPAVP